MVPLRCGKAWLPAPDSSDGSDRADGGQSGDPMNCRIGHTDLMGHAMTANPIPLGIGTDRRFTVVLVPADDKRWPAILALDLDDHADDLTLPRPESLSHQLVSNLSLHGPPVLYVPPPDAIVSPIASRSKRRSEVACVVGPGASGGWTSCSTDPAGISRPDPKTRVGKRVFHRAGDRRQFPDSDWYRFPMMADQPSGNAPESAKRDRQARVPALAQFLVALAVGALVLMAFMTVKTYRTNQEIGTLRTSGVEFTYGLTSCASACKRSFEHQGHTYTDDLLGILNPPIDGEKVAAMVNPESPGSYVSVRSAVFGPNAAGRGAWNTGLIDVLVLAITMIAFAAVLAS